jgi:hypothetical protein
MCESGSNCVKHKLECKAVGNLQAGATCSLNSQCASGMCSSICLAPCKNNSDCTNGLICGMTNQHHVACIAPMATCNCPNANQFCTGDGDCGVTDCETGADCSEDCVMEKVYSVLSFTCSTAAKQCADNEIYYSGSCVLPKECEYDFDCPSGYFCKDLPNLLDVTNYSWAGLCSPL